MKKALLGVVAVLGMGVLTGFDAPEPAGVGSCYEVKPICIQGKPACVCDMALNCFWACK